MKRTNSPPLIQFIEEEGTTWIVEKNQADEAGINYQNIFSWITLSVDSSLVAVGFTAAFSQALSNHGISCNVLAGFYQDHLFIPDADTQETIKFLSDLSKNLSD